VPLRLMRVDRSLCRDLADRAVLAAGRLRTLGARLAVLRCSRLLVFDRILDFLRLFRRLGGLEGEEQGAGSREAGVRPGLGFRAGLGLGLWSKSRTILA